MEQQEIYQQVTNLIIEQLETNKLDWVKSWVTGLPSNYISKKGYRGINTLILSIDMYKNKYQYPYYLTYLQVKQLQGQVKAGSKAKHIVFWNMRQTIIKDKETGEEKKRSYPFLRVYSVFNVEQTNLKIEEVKKAFNPIEKCEEILNKYTDKPIVEYTGLGEAFYNRETDKINLPTKDSFMDTGSFYSVLFHELSHSTGHKNRLNRETLTNSASFGDKNYSKEEVIAELSTAFLTAVAGIEQKTIKNNSAYIQNWIKSMKEDNKFIFRVVSEAQKSADYIQGIKAETKKED